MPTRDIKESCRTSRTLAKVSAGAERLFWRLTTYADDFGRFPADAAVVRAHCFAVMLDTVRENHVANWLMELSGVDLIRFYQGDDQKTYGFFPTWGKHQRTRAKHSKYPAPSSADTCRQMSADVAVVTEEPEDTERTEKAGNTETPDAAPPSGLVVPRREPFDEFWAAYPRKEGKDDALAVWRTGRSKAGRPIPPVGILLAAIERAKQSRDWQKDDGAFIPHPATWLRKGRWDDQPTQVGPMSSVNAAAGQRFLARHGENV